MKKLIVMALGLGLALGSVSFAQDTAASTSTKKTKAKKTKMKKTMSDAGTASKM